MHEIIVYIYILFIMHGKTENEITRCESPKREKVPNYRDKHHTQERICPMLGRKQVTKVYVRGGDY